METKKPNPKLRDISEIKEIPDRKESNLEKAMRLGNDEAIAKAIRDMIKKDEK